MLIFVSPSFQFCLCAKAVMAARFSFAIEGIKEILEWFQEECNLLLFLALFLLIERSCMQRSHFWFDIKLGK